MSKPNAQEHNTSIDTQSMKRRAFLRAAAGTGAVAAVGTASTSSALADDTPTPTPDDGDDGSDPSEPDFYTSPRPSDVVIEGAARLVDWAFGGGTDEEAAQEAAKKTALEAQHLSAWRSTRQKRRSNQRFLSDRETIIDALYDTVFDEATTVAVERMEAGDPKADVKSAALAKVEEMFVEPQKAILDAWESTSHFAWSIEQAADQIVAETDGLDNLRGQFIGTYAPDHNGPAHNEDMAAPVTISTQLFDGTTYEYDSYKIEQNGVLPFLNPDVSTYKYGCFVVSHPDYPNVEDTTGNLPNDGDPQPDENYTYLLNYREWQQTWDYIESKKTDLETEVSNWIESTYDSWQSGDVDLSDMWTPARLRNKLADNESTPQVVADLIGLGIPTDVDRLYTVETSPETEPITWELRGVLALASEPENPIQAGQTYQTTDAGIGTAYLAHRPPEAVGTLDAAAHSDALDGGLFETTSEPLSDVIYQIGTAKGETVTVTRDDFTAVDGEQKWTVDLSEQLDNPITEVAGVSVYFSDDAPTWSEMTLPETFTVKAIENDAGEEVSEADFTDTKPPERADNWTTAEEFDQWRKEQQEFYEDLVKRFEDIQDENDGWSWTGLNIGPDFPTIPGLGAVGTIGAVILGFLGLSAYSS